MINETQKKELFDLYPALSKLNKDIIEDALSRAKAVTLKAGTPIFGELQLCNAFPFVLSGNIRVYKQSCERKGVVPL